MDVTEKSKIESQVAKAAVEYFRQIRAMRRRCINKNSEEDACRFTEGFPQEDWCDVCKNRWPAVKSRAQMRRRLRDLVDRLERATAPPEPICPQIDQSLVEEIMAEDGGWVEHE